MKVILITVPHSACHKDSVDHRTCDRRAYQAAMLIYNRLIELIDHQSFKVVIFPNLTVLRDICDLNRDTPCPLPNIKYEVQRYMNWETKHGEQVVFNIDVHSYPRETHEHELLDTQHFYCLVLGGSVTDKNILFLKNFFNQNNANRQLEAGGPLLIYEASRANHFLTYFESLKIYSILVEFEESKLTYPDDDLERHADLWAHYITLYTHKSE